MTASLVRLKPIGTRPSLSTDLFMEQLLWIVDKQFDVSLDKATWVETIKSLQQHYHCHLLTGYKYGKPQYSELRQPIMYLPSIPKPLLSLITLHASQLKSIKQILSSKRIRYVITSTLNITLLHLLEHYQYSHGLKLFYDVRTLPVPTGKATMTVYNFLFARCLSFCAREFNGIMYITDEMKNFCIKTYGLPDHAYTIWSSGVDSDRFIPGNNAVSNERFTMIYHGTVARKRGIENVLIAMKMIEPLSVELLLVGSGDALDYLKSVASEYGLNPQVKFTGPLPYENIPGMINKAHIGIIPLPNWPGWNVSSPIKLFEYMSCACPVIATDIPAHRSVAKDSAYVFWAGDGRPEHLANAIKSAMKNRHCLRKLGNEARHEVINHFTWKQQAEKIHSFISSQS